MKIKLMAAAGTAAAQNTPSFDVRAHIAKEDAAFWEAYNRCDVDGMAAQLSSDVEFYHDKGGANFGHAEFTGVLRKSLCGNPDFRLRRVAVPGTVQVFPMYKGGKLYGALISGEHQFYINQKGKAEFLDGHSRFTQLWVEKDGKWQMSRILSYDHGPAMHPRKLSPVLLPAGTLERYAGRYVSKTGEMTVRPTATNLVVTNGGKTYILQPSSDTSFFLEDKPTLFAFEPGKDGKRYLVVIREHDKVVAEAVSVE